MLSVALHGEVENSAEEIFLGRLEQGSAIWDPEIFRKFSEIFRKWIPMPDPRFSKSNPNPYPRSQFFKTKSQSQIPEISENPRNLRDPKSQILYSFNFIPGFSGISIKNQIPITDPRCSKWIQNPSPGNPRDPEDSGLYFRPLVYAVPHLRPTVFVVRHLV